jgi:hypothetical protein
VLPTERRSASLAMILALAVASASARSARAQAEDEAQGDAKAEAQEARAPGEGDEDEASTDPEATNGRSEDERTFAAVLERGFDQLVADLFAGTWLDPEDPYWNPRRGKRFEIGVMLGGEGAFSALSTETLPSLGGMVLTSVIRWYPVDRLAVVLGGRTYFGLDGVPATGTTASSVASLITGIRYDLVRENRFSLLWDLYSGPSLYVFADLPAPSTSASVSDVAIGGEMGTALALRYSVGPVTGEARGLVGARAGATSSPFQRAGEAGPFSSVYAGFDLGLTWSFQ